MFEFPEKQEMVTVDNQQEKKLFWLDNAENDEAVEWIGELHEAVLELGGVSFKVNEEEMIA